MLCHYDLFVRTQLLKRVRFFTLNSQQNVGALQLCHFFFSRTTMVRKFSSSSLGGRVAKVLNVMGIHNSQDSRRNVVEGTRRPGELADDRIVSPFRRRLSGQAAEFGINLAKDV